MRNKKQLRVRICPKCKKHRIRFIFTFRNVFGVFPRQRCLDCGYEAQVFPIMIVDKDKLKNSIGKKSKKGAEKING